MERSLWYRVILVVALMVIAMVALVPTFCFDFKEQKSSLPKWWTDSFLSRVLPQANLNLGLDLQGGTDLVVTVNVEDAVKSTLNYNMNQMKDYFKKEDIDYERIEVNQPKRQVGIYFKDTANGAKGEEYIRKMYSDLRYVSGKGTLHPEYAMSPASVNTLMRRSVEQVRNVMSRRIDAFGLREPEIVIQGENQIRLQLPGAKDAEEIKRQLLRSAKLDFMIVEAIGKSKAAADLKDEGKNMNLATWTNPNTIGKEITKYECYFDKSAGVPEGPVTANRRLAYHHKDSKAPDPQVDDNCYLLREDLSMSGADLQDARAASNPEPMSGSAYLIAFAWDIKAANQFAKLTGDNVGKLLAVVLEEEVYSAPVIRSKIFNRGEITGKFSSAEATGLANVLKSGALNVGITFEEQRTVGASLGADAIAKGKRAMVAGAVGVVLFMIIYYSLGGFFADLALSMDILFIFACLSLFGATLTLPGLAGIVLTIGMSVDANVLIFERVREELRLGKTPLAALDAGYSKAFWTIFDSNLTNLIAALVLLQWGTGPIKGFAITLSIGLISSTFTSVVVTRIIYDLIFHYRRGANIHVGQKSRPTDATNGVRA